MGHFTPVREKGAEPKGRVEIHLCVVKKEKHVVTDWDCKHPKRFVPDELSMKHKSLLKLGV